MSAADSSLPHSRRPSLRRTKSWRRAFLPTPRATAPPERRIDARAQRLVEAIRAKAGRVRRRRGISARLFALDQGGAGADGAGRGAVARAGCRDRRPADRRQARRRPLARQRRKIDCATGLGLGLDARRRRPHHSSGRDAGDHPRQHRAPARPAGGARGDAAGDAAHRLAFRASGRPSTRRCIAPAATPSSAIRSTCSARARAPQPTPANISTPMPVRSLPSARKPAMRRCRSGPASR